MFFNLMNWLYISASPNPTFDIAAFSPSQPPQLTLLSSSISQLGTPGMLGLGFNAVSSASPSKLMPSAAASAWVKTSGGSRDFYMSYCRIIYIYAFSMLLKIDQYNLR